MTEQPMPTPGREDVFATRKLYISGPMTGLPEFNFPAFNAAACELRRLGYEVFNPAEIPGNDTSRPREWYMRRDIDAVMWAEGIASLPGWEQSKGARLEVEIARELGLEVLPVEAWQARLERAVLVGLLRDGVALKPVGNWADRCRALLGPEPEQWR